MTAITTTNRLSSRRRHLLAVPAATAVRTEPHTEPRWSAIVIRLAVGADAAKLRRLAHMDSAQPLSGQALIAEQGGSVIAALSLADGIAIADPFVASADAVAMLRVRAAQLSRSAAAAA
ncbi:MAG TPA: hypothetical protein VG293_07000 [Solirubrobacteraceae bacterium]|jgi:hypothetical protein|nr:hypothetical protein [Solirubrobacteraceae bacterium]